MRGQYDHIRKQLKAYYRDQTRIAGYRESIRQIDEMLPKLARLLASDALVPSVGAAPAGRNGADETARPETSGKGHTSDSTTARYFGLEHNQAYYQHQVQHLTYQKISHEMAISEIALRSQMLEHILSALPSVQRDLLHQVYAEKRSPIQLAVALNCDVRTVYNRLDAVYAEIARYHEVETTERSRDEHAETTDRPC